MLIGIDGNEANVEQKVGSNVYAFNLLQQLSLLTNKRSDLKFRIYLKNKPNNSLPLKNPAWNYIVTGPAKAWTQWRLPSQLYFEKLKGSGSDIFFSPGHYGPRKSPIKSVITIMDLAFLHFPNEFLEKDLKQLTAWTQYSVKQAAHIFTISQFSKDDIVDNYHIDPEKITVTYPGFDMTLNKTERDNSYQNLKKQYGIDLPYFLFIGTIQPRKNLERLFVAFSHLKNLAEFKNHQLIIVGKKGWLYEPIMLKVRDLGLVDSVIFTGFLSEFEKHELLRYSLGLVMPSLFEGFGIPVLEALSLGVPVITSRASSLPEVAGPQAMYIEDPTSVVEIEKSLVRMIELPVNQRMEMIAEGKKYASKFSWRQCAQTTIDVLSGLVEQNNKYVKRF
ncbi:hypothetical protein COX08_04150 [Candidatus Beckwithbacteria bacterium CG23_combo_of_CG06-09_8_20_14_all_34_8]|uniref:Glycosyl transferase family 1 domain-containing protein n=1 Tax=Candidatus Beckwithbacteria bacterium CG23_combo_of_CG06-09_8_20_14_all_34_8 TaxID=1974497 RepID=A0A2H0B5G9_9BACT|nr:MAG: hypothetical protein COX08_04150 [Candidatus Beckwithbacteria bacterium CG23_combo_of_CG06-09_8_20_14_all_34_8]